MTQIYDVNYTQKTQTPRYYAGIIPRAAIVAVVIGTVLTLTNQAAAVFGNEPLEYLPMTLGFVTPFIVVAISQLMAIKKALSDAKQNSKSGTEIEGFIATAFGHDIPLRAVIVSLIIGSINSAIIISVTLIENGNLADLPFALMAQAYTLPALFGVLSQAITYRRTLHALHVVV